MRIIIIDDETKARSLLKNIIEQHESGSDYQSELFEAENLLEGVNLIKQHQPKLVFLDIEMPNEQGIEIFKYFDNREITFDLVFTTAYSEYALRAFEMNAIDYILKPIRPKRVAEILDKLTTNFNKEDIQTKLEELKTSLNNNSFNKIGLPVQDGIIFVPLKEIIHLEADGMYTKVHKKDQETLVVSKPLKFFDQLVQTGDTFYRPHRSHIFNFQYLKRYVRKDGNYIVLENEHVLPISKDKKEEFLAIVSAI